MRFTPKTEQEIAEEGLLPAGVYQFEVTESVDYISKSGNEMIKMFVKLIAADGKTNIVTDYLTDKMLYKVLHFCQACGFEDDYNAGTLDAQKFIGAAGSCKVKIQKSDGYPDQNSITDYIVEGDKKGDKTVKELAKEAQAPLNSGIEDDEIPF